MKKLLSILLSLLMLASVIPMTAMAIEAEIISQPSLEEPTFEVSSPEEVEKYEWFITSIEEIAITDENASNVCANCEGEYASAYDAENDLWSGAKLCDAETGYELFYFTIELKENDILYVDAGPEVSDMKLFDRDNMSGFSPSFGMVGNVQVFFADADGNYSFSAITPSLDSKLSAFKLNISKDVLSETETGATLSNVEFGCLYKCVVTYKDGTTLKSNSLPAYPDVVEEPTSYDPTFEVSFEEKASFQWYEVDESGNATALAGENTKTLSSLELAKTYYCEASFPYGMNIESNAFLAEPEIISQPTVQNPTFEVTFENEAKFQWYEATEKLTAVDDTMVKDAYGTYDSETKEWTGDAGDPYEYSGYQEYQIDLFTIELKAGQTVRVTISNPKALSPADPEARFYNLNTGDNNYIGYDKNGVLSFTSEEDAVYELYQFAKYPEEATFKIETVNYDYKEIEGETENTISEMEYGKNYCCIASYLNGDELESKVFNAYAEILSQPSANAPTLGVTFEDSASFQWHLASEKYVVVDDSMPEYEYGTYNEETQQWTGQEWNATEYEDYTEYGLEYFVIYLNKGDTIKVTPSDPTLVAPDNEFRFSPYNHTTDYIEPEEDGTYIFTARHSDIYELYNYVTDPTATIKVEVIDYDYAAIEGETEKTLSEYTDGTLYAVTATYTDGTVLISDVFKMIPAIIKQPTPEDPSVEVNIEEEGMEYQWYKVIFDSVEVTDKNASPAYWEGESIGEPSYYDEENKCWVPSLYDIYTDDNGQDYYDYDILTVELEAGETIIITPSADIKNEYDCTYSDSAFTAETNGNIFRLTTEVTQEFIIYVNTYERDITFTAVIEGEATYEAVESAIGKTLAPFEEGVYICTITYEDGTELISERVKFEEEDLFLLGDINTDGEVDQYDYILAKRIHFNNYTPTADQALRGDVDKDGDNDQYDYILIKRHHFGNYVITY